jgi:hypothetical protein
MNFYMVTTNEGYGAPVRLSDRTQAAELCHQLGVPFFYEISPIDPMTPLKVWTLEPGDTRKPFRLSSRRWLDVVQEHDGLRP